MSQEHHGISNHWQLDYFIQKLFQTNNKEIIKALITGPLWTSGFPYKRSVTHVMTLSLYYCSTTMMAFLKSTMTLLLLCPLKLVSLGNVKVITLTTFSSWIPQLTENSQKINPSLFHNILFHQSKYRSYSVQLHIVSPVIYSQSWQRIKMMS